MTENNTCEKCGAEGVETDVIDLEGSVRKPPELVELCHPCLAEISKGAIEEAKHGV